MESTNQVEESSTVQDESAGVNDKTDDETNQRWDIFIAALLKNSQIDLDKTARETKALIRKREIGSAKDLLHLLFFIAVSGWPFRLIGLWALIGNIGWISDVAIIHRLRKSKKWLEMLVSEVIAARYAPIHSNSAFRADIRDATNINIPGSKGTDWRLHVAFDLGSMRISGINITDQHGCETFGRFFSDIGEIVMGDRGYAFITSIKSVLESGAWLLVRANWHNLKVVDLHQKPFKIIFWLETVKYISETTIRIQTSKGWHDLRLIAMPLPPEKVETARKKAIKRNTKKQQNVSSSTIFAAGFIVLLTNLPAETWSPASVIDFYRFRWQIELLFKRLKSLLDLDTLRVKNSDAAQAIILAKILIAVLVDDVISDINALEHDWFESIDRPVSMYRITNLVYQAVFHKIAGQWYNKLIIFWPLLKRYLCDAPRKRINQSAVARALINDLCLHPSISLS